MKALRTKVILSGIVLVFAFIATIGTTFAWFTTSQSVDVETLTLNVQSADNLLIKLRDYDDVADSFSSTDPTNVTTYVSSLATGDFTTAGYDLSTYRLEPSTIINPGYTAFDATSLSYLSDLTVQDRTLTALDTLGVGNFRNSATGYYVELQFLLFSQSSETKALEFDTPSIQTSGTTAVDNAVRLAVYSGEVDGATEGLWQVFGNTTDYAFGFTSGVTGYLDQGVGQTDAAAGADAPSALSDSTTDPAVNVIADYFNALSNLNTAPTSLNQLGEVDGSALTGSVTAIGTYTGDSATDNPNIINLSPETPTIVSVLIFIEGWGQDADNFIANAQFTITFGFSFGETI